MGTYQCEVEYFIPTDSQPQYASKATDITIKQSGRSIPLPLWTNYWLLSLESDELADLGLSLGGGAGISVSVFLVAVMLIATITLVLLLLVIKISRRRILRRQSRRHLKNVPITFSHLNPLFNKDGPASQFGAPSDIMEFSRNNLEIHHQIGKCRLESPPTLSWYAVTIVYTLGSSCY